jgi:hypothetical protein
MKNRIFATDNAVLGGFGMACSNFEKNVFGRLGRDIIQELNSCPACTYVKNANAF